MGTMSINCGPSLTDLFLCSFEAEFIQTLLCEKKYRSAEDTHASMVPNPTSDFVCSAPVL